LTIAGGATRSVVLAAAIKSPAAPTARTPVRTSSFDGVVAHADVDETDSEIAELTSIPLWGTKRR
jgi:hypothetical protein